MTFFLSWATWAQLTFVIVLTIAGTITYLKLRSTHRHALLCTEQQLEAGEVAINTQLKEEIPFGIRAMDEEPDIEGVWNSRTVTPLNTPVLSPRLGSQESRSLRNVLGRLTHSRQGSSVSSLFRLDATRSMDEKDSDNLYGTKGNPTIVSSPEVVTMTPSTCHTISNIEYLSCSATRRDRPSGAVFLGTRRSTEGCGLKSYNASLNSFYTPLKPSSSLSSQSIDIETSIVINGMPKKSRTIVIESQSCEDTVRLIRTPSTLRNLEVLQRMEAHRQYHAAESGQLQPRIGYATHGNLDRTQNRSMGSILSHETPRSVSWPMTNEEIVISLKPSSKPQSHHSPLKVPFQAFVESHPQPKLPPSSWTKKTQERLDEVLDAKAQRIVSTMTTTTHESNSPRSSISSASEAPSVSSISICNINTRKINPGFEILPAGTFDSALQKQQKQWPESLQTKVNDIKRPAKLQKRSRSQSQGSRSSLEIPITGKENLRATVF